jgi:dTDP-4-dehydrorhamnose 3,5-epimerase
MIIGFYKKKIISHDDKRGFFREIFHSNKNKNIRQVSHSKIKRNIIKAWHIHKKQYQWNYLLTGSIDVFLYDLRKDSKSYKKKIYLKINAKNRIIYFFPPGVAHGYITKSKVNHMIYGTSGFYDIKEEYKIDLVNNIIPNYFKKNH